MGLFDYYPQTQAVQQPDILGNYLRGAFAPGQLTAQQQGIQEGALKIQQLRIALKAQQAFSDMGTRMLTGEGGNADQGSASPSVGRSGGIQNGPQDSVAGTSTAPPMLSYGIDQGQQTAAPSPASTYAGANSSPLGQFSASPGTMAGLEFLKLGMGQAGDPMAVMQRAQEYAIKNSQLQWANDSSVRGEAFLRQMATSPDAPQILQNNIRSLGGMWMSAAGQAGVDTNMYNDAHSVNKVAAMLYNQNAIARNLPPIEAPAHWTPQGIGEGGTQQVNLDTGETKLGITRQEPTKVGERWNPATNQMEAVFQQFAPGSGGVGGAGGSGTSGASTGGSGGSITVPLGYQAPKDPELKSAMFASEMHSGLQEVQKLEARGIKLPPSVRTAMLDAAASDNDGVVHQFMSQQTLLHGLSPDQQTYMQALMPILQAFGHSQAGAKVTLPQMRTNFEGIVPIDPANKEALQQVGANRQGFYVGALSQANTALQLPQYAVLRGELAKAQAQAQAEAKGGGSVGAPGMPSLSDIQAEMARRKQQ